MSQLSQEEAELLSQENRFLKQTIFNLRTELEKLVNDQDSLIQTKIVEFSKQLDLFPDISDILFSDDYIPFDEPHSISHTSEPQRPYYPPKTLDSYVRMITCGKGFSGKIPADVIEKYNKIKNNA